MFKFNLHKDEELLEMYRQSEMVLVKPVLIIFVLIYVPWYFLIKYEMVGSFRGYLAVWTLAVLAYGIFKYLVWLLNVNLLTTQRLICIKYRNLINKKVQETPLSHISNISYSSAGVLPSLFGFGNIEIQIAGLTEPMVLENISRPSKTKDQVWKIHSNEFKDLKIKK